MRHSFLLMVISCLAIAMFLVACERRTTVEIKDHNPPNFALSGSGLLGEAIFEILEESENLNSPKRPKTVWSFAASVMPGKKVGEVRAVIYGVVPQGYRQTFPENGANLPPLEDGKLYKYRFVTANAPHAQGYFVMQNNQPVSIAGKSECLKIENGIRKQIACPESRNKQFFSRSLVNCFEITADDEVIPIVCP